MDKRVLRQEILQEWSRSAPNDRRHINTKLANKHGVSYELVRQVYSNLEYELRSLGGSEILQARYIELGKMALRIKERIGYLQKLKTHTTKKVIKLQNHDKSNKLYTYFDVIFISPSTAELTRITKEQGRLESKLERLLKTDAIKVIAMSQKEFEALDV